MWRARELDEASLDLDSPAAHPVLAPKAEWFLICKPSLAGRESDAGR